MSWYITTACELYTNYYMLRVMWYDTYVGNCHTVLLYFVINVIYFIRATCSYFLNILTFKFIHERHCESFMLNTHWIIVRNFTGLLFVGNVHNLTKFRFDCLCDLMIKQQRLFDKDLIPMFNTTICQRRI